MSTASAMASAMAPTSLKAYAKHIEGSFKTRGEQAYSYLKQYGPMTSNELFEMVKHTFPTSYRQNMVARLGDLRDKGLVRQIGERTCNVSGELVYVWGVVPEGVSTTALKLEVLQIKLERAKAKVSELEQQIAELAEPSEPVGV